MTRKKRMDFIMTMIDLGEKIAKVKKPQKYKAKVGGRGSG